VDELEELDRELDVADPASPSLDFHRLLPPGPDVLLDAHLHVADVLDGRGVEPFRVHHRGQLPQDPSPELDVSRHGAGLQQRLPLPGGGVPPLVIDEGAHGARQRPRPAPGPEVRVDPQGDAVLGEIRQQGHEAAGPT
jgi:hypothetical protein